MTIEIHHITDANKTLLSNVAEDVFDYAIKQKHLADYVSHSNHRLIVATSERIVVGQIRGTLHFQPDEPAQLYIDNLGVTPEFKRQGVASDLINALKGWGKAQGCTSFWVATELDNDEGNQFYKATGLKGEKMFFYEGDL